MKKYLPGLAAVILAIAISAFTKPKNTSRVNYYSFEYLAPGGSYAEVDVENPSPASWGYGTPVNSVCDLIVSCPQENILEKACEIIVAEPKTVLVLGVARRLRTSADGPVNVAVIIAKTINLHINTYMVDKDASPTIDCVENKQF
jgi:hypothetical protein